MTRDSYREFAQDWASWWNSGDVERVLECFDADIVFTSPTAFAVTGSGTVRGKEALRSYWTTALARFGNPHFTVDRVLWDPTVRELAIIYTSVHAGQTKRMSENLRLDDAGKIVSAEVFHGVTAPAK